MLIQKLIQQGTALTECSDYNKAKEEFVSWSQEVRRTAAFCRLSEETQEILNVKLHFHENEYSTEDSMVSLRRLFKIRTIRQEGFSCRNKYCRQN